MELSSTWRRPTIATKLAVADLVGIGCLGCLVAFSDRLFAGLPAATLVTAAASVAIMLGATMVGHGIIHHHLRRLDELTRALGTIHKGAMAGHRLPAVPDPLVEGVTRSAREMLERLSDESLVFSAKLYASLEHDRKRISRELHDETSQTLAAALLNIDLAYNSPLPPATHQQLERARLLLRHSLDQLETVVHDLRPVILDELGLAATLRWYLKTHVVDPHLFVDTDIASTRRLAAGIEISLYRCAQCAIANVLQHACATRLTVALDIKPGYASLRVIDNGRGFNLATVMDKPGEAAGVGLISMQERVKQHGGTCTIRSSPGEGTGVYLLIPLTEALPSEGRA